LLWRFTPRDHWRGLDFKNVADILGNSAKMVAERYGHARDDVQRATFDAVAAKMSPYRGLKLA
jgi:hypothetical protein